ncbi:alcohol dehydrogenase [Bordetella genomosp. 1]|uniref:Alcohol dehydrogenase n=1 Tax=Bordetella genomosp. 1 TaxID=1395607 RepID=A0A261SUS8_9BORD|nr:cytochrome c [Bordetella genomosp. 1]OZI40640.1 alcohol dehydrogenase [Bordetella genomosp. 1]
MKWLLKWVGNVVFGVGALCVLVGLALFFFGTREDAGPPPVAMSDPQAQIERGRDLARLGNCAACHTVRGGATYAGGTPVPTPFGTLYGPNITPDEQTGIGRWSSDDFWRALHNGKGRDGELLYPAFPYPQYTRMSRADADALYAYLRSVPAVRQESRAHELEWPYNRRALLEFWRLLYFRPGVHENEADQSAQWNRGRYLVEGPGHCAACHAPRNSLGASVDARGLPGGMIDGLGWYAPPLNANADIGLGRWSAEDVAALLRSGRTPHAVANGPMAEVVSGSTQYLSDADALAIGVYLKSLPATDTPRAGSAASNAAMTQGGRLYTQHCAQCHQADGRGRDAAWPALAGNATVTAPSAVNAIRVVLDGGFGPATQLEPRPHGMPPFGQMLGDNDIAAVLSYVRGSWGNKASAVTAQEVQRARASR